MHKYLFTLISVFFIQPASAQIVQKYFGRSGASEFILRYAVLTNGNKVAVGYAYPNGTSTVGSDAFITCLDPSDNVLWSKELATAGTDRFTYVTPTSDGGCVAVGYANASGGSTTPSTLVAKFSAAGAVLWTKMSKNTANGEYFMSVAEMPNGHIVCGGSYNSIPGAISSFLLDLDAGGAVLWAKSYDGAGSDAIWGVVAKGADIIAAGYYQSSSYYDGVLLEVDESNGNIKWARSFDYTSTINGTTGVWPQELKIAGNKIYTDNYDFDVFGVTADQHGITAFDTAGLNPVCLEYKFNFPVTGAIQSAVSPSGGLYLTEAPANTIWDYSTSGSNAGLTDVFITKVKSMNAAAPGNFVYSRKLSNAGEQAFRNTQLINGKLVGFGGTQLDPTFAIGTQDVFKIEADTSFSTAGSSCAVDVTAPQFANPVVTLDPNYTFVNGITPVTLSISATALITTSVVIGVTSPCNPGVIINKYAAVLGRAPCDNTYIVDTAAGFNTGDTVLMIQMKGAVIDTTNTTAFGSVLTYNGAGNYELNVVKLVAGNNISLKNKSLRSYDIPGGKVQFVRLPSYANYTVNQKHICLPWNGTKGGIFGINVANTLSLNSDIDVSGSGFRGGVANSTQAGSVQICNVAGFFHGPNIDTSAQKGEGISDISVGKSYGKGNLANGGGGGNAHNAGGGGGSNAGSGGIGGNNYAGCITGPPGPNITGGKPGIALAVNNASNRLFYGGGGGAGHANDYSNADGGAGGGIVFIMAGTIASSAGSINAAGADGVLCTATTGTYPCTDGMGGGGGGGTIVLNAPAFTGSLAVNVRGGNGANVTGAPAFPNLILGPGGGGGGGALWVSGATVPGSILLASAGGSNGVNINQNNVAHGAQDGNGGSRLTSLAVPIASVPYTSPNQVTVGFRDSTIACYTRKFISNSTPVANISSYQWNFGTGDFSTEASPTYTFPGPGTYNVTLTVTDVNGCLSTLTTRITIVNLIKADFLFDPIVPVRNTPVQFYNRSTNADTYAWNFGDGSDISAEVNPLHLFRKSGGFRVCLEARNKSGCIDTICKTVQADVTTAIGVPTGFSPNGDGSNDILYVRGAGIATLNMVIYNRWGQKVFQTNSITEGWDGTYKGRPQEIDLYAYVLVATFTDGKTVTQKGNITLFR